MECRYLGKWGYRKHQGVLEAPRGCKGELGAVRGVVHVRGALGGWQGV